MVNVRYLIIAAVLGTGCEQWKAPKRLDELSGRVEELSKQVAALKGGDIKAKPEDHGQGAGSAHAGTPAGHGAGSGEAAEAGAAASHAAGHEGAAKTVEADKPAAKEDAMDRLTALVKQGTSGKHEGPHWSYEGKTGPPAWGTLDPAWDACGAGKAQSPIDIEPRAGTASPIAFHYKPTAATIVDNGHTLQVNLAPGSSIEIDSAPYELVQFHFHTPSEHTIAGEHYPLEVHLVHKDAKGKLAVIGVLYDAGADSKVLGAVWSKWPRKVGSEDKLRKPFDPATLLPETRSVFRYPGSLTTPPCSEGVVWNVMRRTLSDSRQHLELFAQHYPRNARDPQPLNDRKVD